MVQILSARRAIQERAAARARSIEIRDPSLDKGVNPYLPLPARTKAPTDLWLHCVELLYLQSEQMSTIYLRENFHFSELIRISIEIFRL